MSYSFLGVTRRRCNFAPDRHGVNGHGVPGGPLAFDYGVDADGSSSDESEVLGPQLFINIDGNNLNGHSSDSDSSLNGDYPDFDMDSDGNNDTNHNLDSSDDENGGGDIEMPSSPSTPSTPSSPSTPSTPSSPSLESSESDEGYSLDLGHVANSEAFLQHVSDNMSLLIQGFLNNPSDQNSGDAEPSGEGTSRAF